MKKSGETDKFIRHFRRNSSEHVAAKAKITDKALERLEANAVEKPWEGWDLRMEIAAAPRGGAVVRRLAGASVRRGDVHARAASTCRSTTANGSRCSAPTAAARPRCCDACSAALPLDRRRRAGSGRACRRRARPGAGRVRRRANRCSIASPRRAGSFRNDARSLLAKFGLGAEHVARGRPIALAGRAHTGVARAALGPRRQLPRARRADEPPRPARDRAARIGARELRGTVLLVTHDRALLAELDLTRCIELDGGRVIRDESQA